MYVGRGWSETAPGQGTNAMPAHQSLDPTKADAMALGS
jgi:hypothetical protein